MIARYVQRGEAIDYVPDTPVAAGDVVVLNDLVAVARLDIPAGTLGSLAVGGVYEMPKDAVAIAAGKKVYWKAATKTVNVTASGNTYIGLAINETVAADEFVRVLLNG